MARINLHQIFCNYIILKVEFTRFHLSIICEEWSDINYELLINYRNERLYSRILFRDVDLFFYYAIRYFKTNMKGVDCRMSVAMNVYSCFTSQGLLEPSGTLEGYIQVLSSEATSHWEHRPSLCWGRLVRDRLQTLKSKKYVSAQKS